VTADPTPVAVRSWLGRAWEAASDLLIAIALIWALPLLFAAVAGVLRLLVRAV
jgi:hypothetical protein